jgi:hypothetical protein
MPLKPQFFPTPAAWRKWLEQHHVDAQELWVASVPLNALCTM